MNKRAFEVGTMVEHLKFGRGEVLKVYGDFRDVWFHQLGVEKRIRDAFLARAADQTRPPRRKLRKDGAKTAKAKKPAAGYRWEDVVQAFAQAFPEAFDDPAYLAGERASKNEAVDRARELLAAGPAAREAHRAADTLRQFLPVPPKGKATMLSPFELIALQRALDDAPAAHRLAEAVATLLAVPGAGDEAALGRYFEAVAALPATEKGNPAKWPVATLFPFIAAPDRHMFLKPVATRAMAAALGAEFDYTPTLNAQTYRSLLALAETLRAKLAECFGAHGPKDNIDLQTFIVWCHDFEPAEAAGAEPSKEPAKP